MPVRRRHASGRVAHFDESRVERRAVQARQALREEGLHGGARSLWRGTPSHQFPLGTTMSLRRRAALLAWADRRGGVIVEDDYDTEFRFGGRSLDPLQSLDRTGRVLYVGSFSKVLLPTLRVGFLVAPASLQPALQAARQLTDWHGELATQAALARFIDDGLLARHIRAVTREYAARYARIAEGIERRLARWLRVVPSAAGLHVATHLAPGVTLDLADVVRRAERRGVAVKRLADYALAPSVIDGLVLGFGSIAGADIDEGLARLAGACAASTRQPGRLPPPVRTRLPDSTEAGRCGIVQQEGRAADDE